MLGALAGGVMTYVGLFIINSVISFMSGRISKPRTFPWCGRTAA